MIGVQSVEVPCQGCTRCSHGDAIFLHPELGDVPAAYLTQLMWNPIRRRMELALRRKPDGTCIYLGDGSCTIHERKPVVCREFDCRRFYASFTRAERRRLVRGGMIRQDIFDAARARLHTLPEAGRGGDDAAG
ncbi:YkgJ family cysteine cluster protein [Leptolyngbya sp. 15MV]|nr:YkgJ family cysteine cluster protein [Leptolyngbya sp. 15MV]